MVPPSYGGERTLTGLRYRGVTLNVTVRGYGNGIAAAHLDGRTIAERRRARNSHRCAHVRDRR